MATIVVTVTASAIYSIKLISGQFVAARINKSEKLFSCLCLLKSSLLLICQTFQILTIHRLPPEEVVYMYYNTDNVAEYYQICEFAESVLLTQYDNRRPRTPATVEYE